MRATLLALMSHTSYFTLILLCDVNINFHSFLFSMIYVIFIYLELKPIQAVRLSIYATFMYAVNQNT
jgi:hypothetical protein